MIVRAFIVALLALLASTSPAGAAEADAFALASAPDDTINEFLPEDRGLGECISALPKPGCGSEARGGWRQGVVLLAILGGLGVIAWRVVVGARRARLTGTPTTTSVPDAPGDDRAP